MRLRLVLSGAAVVALGGFSLAIARDNPGFTFSDTTAGGVALLAAGWSLAAAGVVFVWNRPGNVVGLLLLLAGATWLVTEWDNPGVGSASVFTGGLLFSEATPPIVTWAMLAYPSGRLAGAVGRVAVGSAFLAGVVALGLLPALFFDPAAEACSQCPDNLVLLNTDPSRAADISGVGFRFAAATSVATIAVAGWHLARSSAARRRLAALVVGAGALYLALVAWTDLRSAGRGFVGSGDVERRLWLGQAIAIVALSGAVGWGRLHARRTRSSLARLVVDLGEATRTGGLRRALADSLGDPVLDVAYPVGQGRFADASGHVADRLARDDRSATPIVRDGDPVALVLHRPGLLDDPELVEHVASAARLALDNERLQAQLLMQEVDLRASRARVVDAADGERRRLERDVHDGAQQRLVGLLIGVRLARGRLAATGGENSERLAEAAAELEDTVDALRDIAHGIHPAVLTDLGLSAALDALAVRLPLPLRCSGIPERRLPAQVEHAAYRVVADAVRTGEVGVVADLRGGALILDVMATAAPESLLELEDRVRAADGRLVLDELVGGGIRLHVTIPCEIASCE